MSTKVLITDIQRSSVHDGPGFRTTVFFKGCQMRCAWCHNPETISPKQQTLYDPSKCIGCGHCAEGCFSGARVLCGREAGVEDIMREIRGDSAYYGESGGVTFSGGEPLLHAAFLTELMDACEKEGIRCAMESNMALPWETAEPVLKRLQLLMADLKTWDSGLHRQYTGTGNELVKENLLRSGETGVPLLLRTPVVPGVNANEEEIFAIASFAAKLPNLVRYELLSYHPLGISKAEALGMEIREFEKPDRALMEKLTRTALSAGTEVSVNGVPSSTFLKEVIS